MSHFISKGRICESGVGRSISTAMPLEPLWESHEMYQKSFQALIGNSTARRPAMLNFTQDGIRQAMLKIIDKVNIDEPPRVLGIGSGSGESDLLILQTMAELLLSQKTERPTIQNVIVEPSPPLLDQFKMKASSPNRCFLPMAAENVQWIHSRHHYWKEQFRFYSFCPQYLLLGSGACTAIMLRTMAES